MVVTELKNPIDVFIRKIGYCKCIAWIDYGPEVNTMWKCRVYETGRVINAYDDDVIIYPNAANAEGIKIPADWDPKDDPQEIMRKMI